MQDSRCIARNTTPCRTRNFWLRWWIACRSRQKARPTSAYIGLHRPTSAYIGLHGPTSAYIGLHGPTWAYMGLHGPTWAYMGLHRPTSAYIGLHRPTSAYIGPGLQASENCQRNLTTTTGLKPQASGNCQHNWQRRACECRFRWWISCRSKQKARPGTSSLRKLPTCCG